MGTKFGETVKRMREERGLTQRELARRAGLNVGYYCRAENGKIPISDEAVLRIADVLRVSSTELLAAAEKLRYRFPYDSLSEGARQAFRKLGEGAHLTRDEQDSVLHVLRSWELRAFGYHKAEEAGGYLRSMDAAVRGERAASRYEYAFWINAARVGSSPAARREEAEALGILAEFRAGRDADGSLRVPVLEIAQDVFHLTSLVADLSRLGLRRDAVGALSPREGVIWISDRIREDGCARFTVAHEIHHFLHWWPDGEKDGPNKQGTESRANRFAASLLMPEAPLRRVVNRWQLKDPDYRYALAVAHGVSVQAMEWRLASLGLVRVRMLAQTHKSATARRRDFRPTRFPTLTPATAKANSFEPVY